LAPHAAALIAYAETDAIFGLTLATMVQEEQWSTVLGPHITPSRHYQPTTTETAEDILDWIMYELLTHPEARVSRSILSTWVANYEAPQDLIWGLAMTDTFGPTFTGQPKKHHNRAQLQIVVDTNWAHKQSALALSQTTHELSQALLAIELRKAGGKISSLHPDTAEWSMGGSATELLETDQETLAKLHKTAMDEQLHHQLLSQASTIKAIAISPSVNDALVHELV